MDLKSWPTETGADNPEDIDETHHEDSQSHFSELGRTPLDVTRQQQQKGNKEVQNHQSDSYPFPATIEPAQVPRIFIRQISGPDNQELRESDVGPKDNKGQQKIAKIVEMKWLDCIRVWFALRQ